MLNRIALVSFAALILGLAGCSRDEEVASPEYPETREIVLNFRLQNNVGRELPVANISLYLPMARSSSQTLLEFSVGGTLDAAYRHVEDEAGNSSVFYELKNLPVDFTRTVRLHARVGFAATPHEVQVLDLERYLEVTDVEAAPAEAVPAIVFTETDNTQAKLLKIAAALSPQPAAGAGSAASIDNAGCMDRVQKFTRLARMNQIAVRPVIGFRAPAADTAGEKPQYQAHCWAEYYDQNRWQAIDVMESALVTNVKGYLALRSFYSLQNLQQQTFKGLMAEGFGLTIEAEMPE